MVGVVGFMSSGKTYFAVEQILVLIQANHPIVTNIRLNCVGVTQSLGLPCVVWKRLLYTLYDEDERAVPYHGVKLDDYWSYPQGSPRGSPTYNQDMVYVFLDEASSVFDSMVQARDSNIVKVATWARQTRKRGIEVVLLMQFANELNKRLRTHIVEYIYCNNSNNIKIPVVGTRLPFFLRDMSVRQRFASDGVTPIGDSVWRRFVPYVYRCYDTSAIVVGTAQPSERVAKIDTSQMDLQRFLRQSIYVLAVVVVFIYLGVLICVV